MHGRKRSMSLMKAAVFVEPGRIVLDDKPIPESVRRTH
jgi:hypothetical protein